LKKSFLASATRTFSAKIAGSSEHMSDFINGLLAGIQSGVIRRDERFGYVELATDGYRSACFNPAGPVPPQGSNPPPFIKIERWEGKTNVTFAVEMRFDFASGQPTEWQRLRTADGKRGKEPI
jgi:hypothetical protein